jgi:hypothetical protein
VWAARNGPSAPAASPMLPARHRTRRSSIGLRLVASQSDAHGWPVRDETIGLDGSVATYVEVLSDDVLGTRIQFVEGYDVHARNRSSIEFEAPELVLIDLALLH